jgi:hypothetical protein
VANYILDAVVELRATKTSATAAPMRAQKT